MIVAEDLTKRYGHTVAVDHVSFQAQPGAVVALIGHEGAGKTTTLRMLVGQVTPTSGRSTILGKPFGELAQPLQQVGVLLGGLQPGHTPRDHLRICTALAGLRVDRSGDVLRLTGLQREADHRIRSLPAGMRRRLQIAAALLADPQVLILDEPGGSLDPEGRQWLHSLLRELADNGRTVLFSSQSYEEVDDQADQLLVLDRGVLLAQAAPDELTRAGAEVLVRSPGAEVLAEDMRDAGLAPSSVSSDELRVRDASAGAVARVATSTGVPVSEIRMDEPSLADAVAELTAANGAARDGGAREDRADGGHQQDGGRGGRDGDDAAHAPADEEEAALDEALAGLRLERSNVVAVLAPANGLGRTTLSFLAADVLAACAGIPTLALALSYDHDRMSIAVTEERRTSLALADLLGDLPEFDETAHISPYVSEAQSGAHVLSGPSQEGELEALEPAQLDALLDFAARFYALVVIDVGGLREPSLRAVVGRADRVLLLGTPGAAENIDERSAALRAIESERREPALLVFNRVDADRLRALARGGARSSYVLIPEDRELIRALDSGEFALRAVAAVTRVALKRLALALADGLR